MTDPYEGFYRSATDPSYLGRPLGELDLRQLGDLALWTDDPLLQAYAFVRDHPGAYAQYAPDGGLLVYNPTDIGGANPMRAGLFYINEPGWSGNDWDQFGATIAGTTLKTVPAVLAGAALGPWAGIGAGVVVDRYVDRWVGLDQLEADYDAAIASQGPDRFAIREAYVPFRHVEAPVDPATLQANQMAAIDRVLVASGYAPSGWATPTPPTAFTPPPGYFADAYAPYAAPPPASLRTAASANPFAVTFSNTPPADRFAVTGPIPRAAHAPAMRVAPAPDPNAMLRAQLAAQAAARAGYGVPYAPPAPVAAMPPAAPTAAAAPASYFRRFGAGVAGW